MLSRIKTSIVNDDLATMSFGALRELVDAYARDLYEYEGASIEAADRWRWTEIAALDELRPGFERYYIRWLS